MGDVVSTAEVVSLDGRCVRRGKEDLSIERRELAIVDPYGPVDDNGLFDRQVCLVGVAVETAICVTERVRLGMCQVVFRHANLTLTLRPVENSTMTGWTAWERSLALARARCVRASAMEAVAPDGLW